MHFILSILVNSYLIKILYLFFFHISFSSISSGFPMRREMPSEVQSQLCRWLTKEVSTCPFTESEESSDKNTRGTMHNRKCNIECTNWNHTLKFSSYCLLVNACRLEFLEHLSRLNPQPFPPYSANFWENPSSSSVPSCPSLFGIYWPKYVIISTYYESSFDAHFLNS